MKVEWSESIDKGGMPLRECKVGRFWLVVQQDDDNGREWDAWVDAEYEWSSAEHREAARVPIGQSIGHKSCEDAQAAAAAMLAAMTAPFVDAAIAEERAECARLVERLAGNADSAWNRYEDVLRDVALAIRYRSHEEPKS